MRLCELKIRNYRTLESLDVSLPTAYAAICGANDSGKTNVIRAIRTLVRGEGPGPFVFPPDQEELSIKDEFPKWKEIEPDKREISFEAAIELDPANATSGSINSLRSSCRFRSQKSRFEFPSR